VGVELWWVPVAGRPGAEKSGDGAPVQIGHLPDATHISWQPGGGRLVYYARRVIVDNKQGTARSLHSLYLANRDGSGAVELPGPVGMSPVDPWEVWWYGAGPWSLDGRWLVTQDREGHTYLLDTDHPGAPLQPNVERVHGWLDAQHYLASTFSSDTTTLLRCALPETCHPIAQIKGQFWNLAYNPQHCTVTRELPVLPTPTPEMDAVPALIETILNDPSKGARSEATARLGHIAPPEIVVPVLIQSIQKDPGMRWISCEVLHGIGPAAVGAVPTLIEALEDGCSRDDKTWCDVERGALTRTLRAITEQDLGEDAAAWRAWWNEQQ
jgi:hypothetical protein